MKAPFSFLPVLPAATGVVAGILMYTFISPTFCMIAGASCLLLFLALYATERHYLSFYFLSAVAGLCCAYANSYFRYPVDFAVPGNHYIKARVIENNVSTESPSLTVELLKVDSTSTFPFRCILTLADFTPDAELHSIVNLQCRLDYISSRTDVPLEYDNTQSMFNDGIFMMAYPIGKDIIISPPAPLFRTINNVRDCIYRSIVNSPISGKTVSFMLAVILGERSYLGNDTLDSYRALGIAHILALSGLHVGIIASLFGFLIWPVRLLPHYRIIRVFFLMAAIWIYTIVCGLGDSILRAAVMLSIMSISSLLQRNYYPLNALLFAATIILCCNPSSLFSPGFQLSFAAVLSIILFAPIVPKTLRKYPVLFFLVNLIVLPVAAMLGTGLISAFHFSTFPLAFLPANILVGLIFPYILFGGIIISFFTAFGIDFVPLGYALDHALSFMCSSIDCLEKYSPSPVGALHFSAWAFIPYAAAIGLLALAINRRLATTATAAVALFIITFVVMDITKSTVPSAELYIIRHPSTCIMVRSGNNAALLSTCREYDTLVTRQIVESKCQDFLKSRGCKSLANLHKSPSCVSGFYLIGQRLYAGDRHFFILNDDNIDVISGVHPDYLYVGQKFSGNLKRAIETLSPDSIILAADIHPSRRKRFIREIDDSSILIDLRERQFALTWAK